MMVFKFFSKIKYRCLIGLLGCIVLFVTGCGTADEAIVLIPPGESVAEFPELEAAEHLLTLKFYFNMIKCGVDDKALK